MKERYESGLSFDAFLATAQQNRELWATMYKLARVPRPFVDRVLALPRKRHLLVLNEDWCGDAVNTVPYVVRLAEQTPGVELRVLARDQHLEVMDAHLTNGARSIPIVVALDAGFTPLACWGPRPAELQQWRFTEGAALDSAERYKRMRGWYARDRGRSTVNELLMAVEDAVNEG